MLVNLFIYIFFLYQIYVYIYICIEICLYTIYLIELARLQNFCWTDFVEQTSLVGVRKNYQRDSKY